MLAATVLAGCGGGSTEALPQRVDPSPVPTSDAVPPLPSLPDADALTETAQLLRVGGLRTRPHGPTVPGLDACEPAATVRIAERRDGLARVVFRSDDVDLFVWVPERDLGPAPGTPATVSASAGVDEGRELAAQTRLYDDAGTLVGRARRDCVLDVGDDGQLRVPTPCGTVTVHALGFATP